MKRRKQFECLRAAAVRIRILGQCRPRSQITVQLHAGIFGGKNREAGHQRARLAARRAEFLRRKMQPRQRLAR